MTPAELRAAVHHGAGRSPGDHVLGIRLGRTQELLAPTEPLVAAVARHAGHADPDRSPAASA